MSEVILYDLPSKDRCACWSLNPWKTRLFLNVKGIPYETQWIEYPDIAPTFKSFGIPPNAEGTPYTVPTIRIGDKYIMDSREIADELEKQHPSPSLHLDSAILPKVQKIIIEGMGSLRGVIMPKIPHTLLNEASVPYWNETRSKRFGMPLPQFEKEQGGDEAWEKVAPAMKELGALLEVEVSYADLVVVGALQFLKRVREDFYDRAVANEPALKDLYEASKTWLERDDH